MGNEPGQSEPLLAAFKTIDLRVASLRDGSRWVNGLTVIRLTRLSKEDVTNTHEMLTAKWGEVNLDQFRILLDTEDFGEWDRLVASIANGNLRISGLVDALRDWHLDFETIHPFPDGNRSVGGIRVAAYSHQIFPINGWLGPKQ